MTFNRVLNRSSAISLPWLYLLFLLAGCGQEPPASGLPTVQMKLGSKIYTLEVAADDSTRERGLMRRDWMAEDHGMIFVFHQPQRMSFWMKNTRIPLDIVYIDASGRVDSIKQMQPYVEKGVWSDGVVKWAIELNKGQAASAGIKVGDNLDIPDHARSTAP